MIDIRLLREDPERLRQAIRAKKATVDFDRLLSLEVRRREVIQQIEDLSARRKQASKEIGARVQAGEDPEEAKAGVRRLGEELATAETEQRAVIAEFEALVLTIPNLPHESTPVGAGEADNREVSVWGEKPAFDFAPRPHWEIGESLDILDLARGTKLSGSGYYVLKGAGARLERALINWFLQVHVSEFGYMEIMPPFVVNSRTMTGTGQLPKMAEDMYRIGGMTGDGYGPEDAWLIPTAEVPVTNLYQDEILDGQRLPIYHCAYTPCFRREAGSYGKEVRGITRVHQFNKVEMVKFVKPETSYQELETLLGQAETLLQRLGLTYRVVELCTADLSFAAAKCYDLEVWAPGMGIWLEVSSCSNFEDFQARRAGIRFKAAAQDKPQFVHTLNGSGLALPRTMIAILETYQQSDGTVVVPEVLRGFMGCERIDGD